MSGVAAGTARERALAILSPMSSDDYRSYVIRVRRRAGDGPNPGADMTTRLDVEDLLEGGTVTVSGEPARSLADSLERLVDAGRPNAPAAADLTEGPATA